MLKEPVLILLDTYEKVSETKELVEWIETRLLAEAEECEHLRFVIAGQKVPDSARARWGDCAETVKLERIYNQRIWQDWVREINPNVDEKHVEGIVLGLEGLQGRRFPCDVLGQSNTKLCGSSVSKPIVHAINLVADLEASYIFAHSGDNS
jgi:hypothetical protein